MGSMVGGGRAAQAATAGENNVFKKKYGNNNAFEGFGKTNALGISVGPRLSKKSLEEKTVDESLGSVSSVSTIRKNRGLLSNSMSDTLG